MSSCTQLKPCRTQNNLFLGSSNCIVFTKNTIRNTFALYKRVFSHACKAIKFVPFMWVLLEFLILVDRKRCKSDGSQSYDIAITVWPSQQHSELLLSRWMTTWMQHNKLKCFFFVLLYFSLILLARPRFVFSTTSAKCYVCEQGTSLHNYNLVSPSVPKWLSYLPDFFRLKMIVQFICPTKTLRRKGQLFPSQTFIIKKSSNTATLGVVSH
jgi:hypothetical protein